MFCLAQAAAAADFTAHFGDDLKAMTAAPHRLAGTDNALQASRYVENRLRQMGLAEVFVQEFGVTQCLSECSITPVIAGKLAQTFTEGIHALRPNHLQGVVTPPEGLTGRCVYAGSGKLSEYAADPRDAVVVLEWAAGERWQHAFAMGAKAVIFIHSDEPAPNPYHHLNVPANLPRFYVTAELAQQFGLRDKSPTVTLKAKSRWQAMTGRNVIGIIRGQQPKFDRRGRAEHESLLLAASLDSLSEAPTVSPGARRGANAALLLALAEHLSADRPRRDVIVCFFDGDCANNAGARAFYGALYRERGDAPALASRIKMLEAEHAYITQVAQVLGMTDIFCDRARQIRAQHDACLRMSAEASSLSGRLREDLQVLRLRRLALQERLTPAPAASQPAERPAAEPQAMRAELDQVKRQIADLEGQAIDWSNLERTLNERLFPQGRGDPDGRIQPKYLAVLKTVQEIVLARQRELEALLAQARQGAELLRAVGQTHLLLHLSLELGDDSARWCFIQGQDALVVHEQDKDKLGFYNSSFEGLRENALPANLYPNFESRTVDGGKRDVRMYGPALLAHSGAAAVEFGVGSLAIMTPMDRRPRDGQPCDVLERAGPDGRKAPVLNVGHMLTAIREVAPYLRSLGDREKLAGTAIDPAAGYTECSFAGGKSSGGSAMMLSGTSVMPDRAARGGFVAVTYSPAARIWNALRGGQVPPGFDPVIKAPIDVNGRFELPPLSKEYHNPSLVIAATFDPTGLIEYVGNSRTVRPGWPLTGAGLVLFNARAMTQVGMGHDRGGTVTQAMKASSTAQLNEDQSLIAESDDVLTVFARRGTDRIKLFNAEGMCVLNNAPRAGVKVDPVLGLGRPLSPFEHWPTAECTAADLHALNDARLSILRANRIMERSLEQYHVEAREVLEQAQASGPQPQSAAAGGPPAGQAAPPQQVDVRQGKLSAAAAISRRVYAPLLSVLNDLVVAVVLLLLLAMPFAFAGERLLVGTPHIYRQIGWFVFFFLLTFSVLYLVNPAFKIASTPVIIFLAFAIILLSSIVIVIMSRKLEAEVRRMQGLGASVHSSDVSRLGTMMAAVSMGISTMRRRPIRTLLTAVTVLLLTFTILTFASFTSSWGNRKTYVGALQGPPRLMVRHAVWTRISEQIPEMLEGFLKGRAAVVPRYWLAMTADEVETYRKADRVKSILVSDAAGSKVLGASGLVGIDRRDVERLPQLRELLAGQVERLDSDGVFLTESTARRLGLTPGDAVRVDGLRCTLAGAIDIRKLTSYRMLEGSSLLPVDYERSGGGSAQDFAANPVTGGASLADMPEMESARFSHLEPDMVVFLPAELARRLGGRVSSVNIYPDDPGEVERLAEQVALVTRLPTYRGAGGGVYRLFFTSLAAASGWRDLIIPVVLGGLIIFATMLGSVTDREKEIYAFSALGLAPAHVASLFFAEAGVYAVVGGMGGYLLGQVVARGLNLLAEHDWLGRFSVPTMNYSSTNAITTVLVVMATVLVSTTYPAIKASRSANPGIQRSWKVRKPEGDLYDLVFPFTVSAYDITGVVSFLREHFQNFSDTALGNFATSRVHVFRQSGGMLGLEAEVALAPFDLGVAQRFDLLAQHGEIEGIEEIRIFLHRQSGTRGDWQRANRVFINELRKQLLIWRSLAPEIMERYRQTTLRQWDSLPVQAVTSATFGETP